MPYCFQVGSKLLDSRYKLLDRVCWRLLETVHLLSEPKVSGVVLRSEGRLKLVPQGFGCVVCRKKVGIAEMELDEIVGLVSQLGFRT